MNKYIKEQLEKIDYLLPVWDENTLTLVIPRKGDALPKQIDLQVGQVVTIKIENYIVNPPEGFTLAENWNRGTNPPAQLMKGEVIGIMGKMVQFRLTDDSDLYWEGWLPRKGFTIC